MSTPVKVDQQFDLSVPPSKCQLIEDFSITFCSSESDVHKSSNVLVDDTFRIWQTSNKESKAVLEIQFPSPTKIKAMDIGNAGSAFIEILVGMSNWEATEFQVMVPITNFMSFSDTKNNTNRNRIKRFDQLTSATTHVMWDKVRIICTQPFSSDFIGLSSLRFYSPQLKTSSSNINEQVLNRSNNKLKNSNNNVLDKSIDKNNTSQQQQQQQQQQQDQNEDGEPKTPPTSIEYSMETDITPLKSEKTMLAAHLHNTNVYRSNSSLKKSKTSLLFNPLPGEVVVIRNSSKEKLVNNDDKMDITEDEKIKTTTTTTATTTNTNEEDDKTDEEIPTDVEEDNIQVLNTPKKYIQTFSQLLSGVVLVIGGIVNPEKGQIRDKAIEMGATYQPDWTREATHLITPFAGTPKFNQAKKSGGTIAHPNWIKECYKQKARLPVSNFPVKKQIDEEGEEEKPKAKSKSKSISTTDKKKKKKKGAANVKYDDSDDDSHIPDEYDYDDGFLVKNEEDSSGDEYADDEDDDDDPDNIKFVPENVSDLVKDGLGYLKRTYDNVKVSEHLDPKKKRKLSNGTSVHSSPSKNNEYSSSKKSTSTTTTTTSTPNNTTTGTPKKKQYVSPPDSPKEIKKQYGCNIDYDDIDDPMIFNAPPVDDTIAMTPKQVLEEVNRIVIQKKTTEKVNNSFDTDEDEDNESRPEKYIPTTSNTQKENINNNNNNNSNNDSTKKEKQQSPKTTTTTPSPITITPKPKSTTIEFGKEYILNPLPDFFDGLQFYLSIKNQQLRDDIFRLITTYKGNLSTIPTKETNFIITDKTWDRLFDITIGKFPNVKFVKPSFVILSHNNQTLSPIENHLIVK